MAALTFPTAPSVSLATTRSPTSTALRCTATTSTASTCFLHGAPAGGGRGTVPETVLQVHQARNHRRGHGGHVQESPCRHPCRPRGQGQAAQDRRQEEALDSCQVVQGPEGRSRQTEEGGVPQETGRGRRRLNSEPHTMNSLVSSEKKKKKT